MKALTYRRIQMMAYEIAHELVNRGYNDTRIYYNNRALDVSFDNKAWLHDDKDLPLANFGKIKRIVNINPTDYFEYAASAHILSMSFEGELYDRFYNDGCPNWLEKIFDKYEVRYELGNNWNLTCYSENEDMHVDYTFYTKPKQPICLYNGTNDNGIFQPIMNKWRERSRKTGDIGSCVIGAGIEFKYNDNNYFMFAQSPWQGSCSWEAHIDWVKQELAKLGCTDIYYNCGRMD